VNLPTQSVYSKALVLFLALSFLLGTATVVLTRRILFGEFREYERQEMIVALQRLNILLPRALENLAATLVNEDAAANSPLLNASIPRVDLVARISRDGNVLPIRQDEDVSLTLSRADVHAIFEARDKDRGAGFLRIGGQLAGAAWTPDVGGESKDTALVAVRTLDADSISIVETILGAHITFHPLHGVVDGRDDPIFSLLKSTEFVVRNNENDTVRGFTLVRGADGLPIGYLEIAEPRRLLAKVKDVVELFVIVLSLAGGALVLLVWVLLDQTILTRIRTLTNTLEAEKSSGRLPVKVRFYGEDELGQLARTIEELASELEQTQAQYRLIVEDQTEIICRFDEDFAISFANGVFRKQFVEDVEPTAAHLGSAVPPDTFRTLCDQYGKLSPEEPVACFDHEIPIGYDGIWLRSTLRRTFADDGAGLGGQWVGTDITSQVEAQQRLEDSERELRALSGRLLHLQDEERRRIARELHDSTAQSLSALEMNFSILEPLVDSTNPRTGRLIRESREIARSCSKELRTISYLLHPPLLDEVGLTFAIRWFVDGFAQRTQIAVEVNLPDNLRRMPSDVETTLFRVVQESLTNIYRHANSATASITLTLSEQGMLHLSVRDNGRGFPKSAPGSVRRPALGVGLAGMKERLRQVGGALKIRSTDAGTEVVATVEIPPPHSPATPVPPAEIPGISTPIEATNS